MKFTDAFHERLRETLYAGQTDIYGELGEAPATNPNARCKGCGQPWRGEDSRPTPMAAFKRKCWLVTNSLIRCNVCHAKRYSDESGNLPKNAQ